MNVTGLSNGSYRVNDTLPQKDGVRTGKESTDFQNTFNGIHTLVMGGLSSRGLSDGGCVTVYKAEGYSSENPIMRVVTRAADGQEYEQFIEPTKVNPTGATENEMSALTAYLVEEKKLDSVSALGVGAGAAKGTANVSNVSTERKNFYALTQEMMKMQYDSRNFAGYALYKKILSAYDVFMS